MGGGKGVQGGGGGGEGGCKDLLFFLLVFAKESPRKARRTGSWAGVCLYGFGLELGFGAGFGA